MGTEPTTQDANTDDQELAKALAGMNDQISSATSAANDLAFEETPAAGPVAGAPFGPSDDPNGAAPTAPAAATFTPPAELSPVAPQAAPEPVAPVAAPASDTGLETIKKDALNELRPLVGKLTVPPEEKFDTYLLLLRSTDDVSLIGPAHDAAKEIPDEARRAQALLDVIKEIDYLSSHN